MFHCIGSGDTPPDEHRKRYDLELPMRTDHASDEPDETDMLLPVEGSDLQTHPPDHLGKLGSATERDCACAPSISPHRLSVRVSLK